MAYLCGIYLIRNRTNYSCYVGSSVHIERRWALHRHELLNNIHHSRHLQNSWNKHGSENFEFVVVEHVPNPKHVVEREQYWIDALKPKYNIHPNASSPFGVKRSEETRAKLRNVKRPWNAERNRTPKMRASSSARAILRNKTPEMRAVSSKRRAGISNPHTPETRAIMKLSKLGERRSNNTSGQVGVTYEHKKKLWRARINSHDGRRIGLGRFKRKEDAAAAYNAAFNDEVEARKFGILAGKTTPTQPSR